MLSENTIVQTIEKANQAIGTAFFGPVFYFDSIASTNSRLFELAKADAREGTVVIANAQESGRGRSRRNWYSPPDGNIFMSLLLRPLVPVHLMSPFPLVVAQGVFQALLLELPEQTHSLLTIKWPNDLLFRGKKISGILVESSMTAQDLQFVIVGVGLNVNMDCRNLPKDIQRTASSLANECGHPFDCATVLRHLLVQLQTAYREFSVTPAIDTRWFKERMIPFDAPVKVMDKGMWIDAVIQDLLPDGSLLVHTSSREIIHVHSPENLRHLSQETGD